MCRRIARLLPFCLLATACGSSARQQALLERRETIRDSNAAFAKEAFANYRSSDGFQETRWGMSPEDVKALYPEAWTTSPQGDLRVTQEVAERPATLDFLFVQHKLAAVSVVFKASGPLRDEFSALARALRVKYGEPVLERDTAADAEARLRRIESNNRLTESNARLRELNKPRQERSNRDPVDPSDRAWEEEARMDNLQAQLDYALEQGWKNPQTELRLSGQRTPDSQQLTLVYLSRFLKPHLKETLSDEDTHRVLRQAQDL
ncbi:hypothetical protein [Myxococcus sp. Y35]|uniref:hypothetical protein n=1 Tax=Pseudomyxococcus flavus TaxID=3115648 RepID=UPI003CF93FC0